MNRIVFLGSKYVGYKCLQYLTENCFALDVEIVGVLSNNNSVFGEYDLKAFCTENAINYIDEIDQLGSLDDLDYIVSVQYHQILKQEHLNKASKLAINLHMAPLPEYRGCNQFSYAIIDQKNYFGTTLHVMNEKIDSGDILAENRFEISSEIRLKELYDLTVFKSIELFSNELPAILSGNYKRTPQNTLIAERGTSLHQRKDIDKLKNIDLSWDKEKIERYIRATNMPGFEPPYTLMNGKKKHLIDEYGNRILLKKIA